jgi:methionine biosynthesis protein MetW
MESIASRPDLLAVADLINPGEKVLDLGCGDGTLLLFLQEQKNVIARGVELHEKGVLACVHRGLSVRHGNLHEGLDDYPDGAFDTVILSHTLPYINHPPFVLKEMLRVGTRAIVSFPNLGYWRYRVEHLVSGTTPVPPELPHPWKPGPRARSMTIRDFKNLCKAHGIQITEQINLRNGHHVTARIARDLRTTSAIFLIMR